MPLEQAVDTLKITYPMEDGVPGVDDDPQNPLSRALATLMGKKSSRLPAFAQAFLIDDKAGEPARYLGVFVKSDGGRIIFFPGFKELPSGIQGLKGKKSTFRRSFAFDHISLEQDRASWHVTSGHSRDHQRAAPTKNLGDGRILWFGMSLASLSKLRVLRRETVATFKVEEKSSRWKVKEFSNAVSKTIPIVIRMPIKGQDEKIFPLITVIVGPRDFEVYQGTDIGWAYGSEFVSGEPESSTPIACRIQRFRLDETTDIQTTSIWSPGKLRLPSVLATPFD